MRLHLKQGKWTLADIGTSEQKLNEAVRDYHKREASRWLKFAYTTDEAHRCIEEMDVHLKQGYWTLDDIGTRADKLETVMSNYHKSKARSLLQFACTTGKAPDCIEDMRKHLRQGFWTLADIGTSEDKLKTVVRNYHKREAKKWLDSARGVGLAPACIEHMREHLKQGNWTLADIGTSEDDLKTVIRNYHKREAKKWLDSARGVGLAPACIEHMREHLKQGNWTLTDIDTSEEKLKEVVRDYYSREARTWLQYL
jgi:soluble cytochrome b562